MVEDWIGIARISVSGSPCHRRRFVFLFLDNVLCMAWECRACRCGVQSRYRRKPGAIEDARMMQTQKAHPGKVVKKKGCFF